MKAILQVVLPSKINYSAPLFPFQPLGLPSEIAPSWFWDDGQQLRPLGKTKEEENKFVAFVFPTNSSQVDLWEQSIQRLIALNRLTPWEFLTSYVQLNEPPYELALKLGKELKLDGRWFKQGSFKNLLQLANKLMGFCDLEKLSFREMKVLTQWNPEELQVLAQYFYGMHLKGNRLIQLLEPLKEVQDLKSLAITELLTLFSGPADVAKELDEIKHPKLTSYRAELKKLQESFPPEIQLQLDPWFEQDQISIQISASDSTTLKAGLTQLENSLQDGRAEKLFALI